jgi:hypothetical protein
LFVSRGRNGLEYLSCRRVVNVRHEYLSTRSAT